jgi:diaminobutyrate--2-oxoglutarate aminotransferase
MKLADLLETRETPASDPVSVCVSPDTGRLDDTVHELFRKQAGTAPEAMAVTSPDARMTYAELDRQSDNVAGTLSQHGVVSEEFVLVIMDRSPQIVVAMLGILKAGAAYVPVLPTEPIERIEYVMRDSRSRIVISDPDMSDLAESLRPAMASQGMIFLLQNGHLTASWRSINKPCFSIDGVELKQTEDHDNQVRYLTPRVKKSSGSALAYLMYTSGTSGHPKGVMIEHRAIIRLVIDAGYVELRPDDRILQTGSLAFDAATFEIWGALLNGASVHIAPRDAFLRPQPMKAIIEQEGITILFLTTVLFNQLAGKSDRVFDGVRVLLTGGERVSAMHMMNVRSRYPHLELLHVYGPTENTTFSTAFRVRGEYAIDVPIGVPIAGSTALVLSRDLRIQSPGGIGELCTGGSGLARGYLNDPALTAEKFVPNPNGNGERIYRSGDLARWATEYGSVPVLQFCGRIDDQVKIRGYRVEPGEIEAHLRRIEGVRDAAVVHSINGDNSALVAYVVGDARLDVKAIRNGCKEGLSSYMVPNEVILLDRFPLNTNGKIDRDALPLPNRSGKSLDPVEAEQADSTLAALRAIWEEVLNQTDFNENADFFDLGGHSFLAVQMVSLVEERLNISLPINVIFDTPTLSQLADYLLDSARFGLAALDDGMVLMSGDPMQGHSALFAFPPATADCLGYTDLARSLQPHVFYGFTFLEQENRIAGYADLIENSAATEPYSLLGYSSGGNLAYHVASELEARGKRVRAVIMIDSARRLMELNIPHEKMTQIARDFLCGESVEKYLASPVLRDRAFRNIIRNLEYISHTRDAHRIKADIHLIECENSAALHIDDDGRTVTSKRAWGTATTGRFFCYDGAGSHDYMLHPPNFERNTALIRAILKDDGVSPVETANSLSRTTLAQPDESGIHDPLTVFNRLESGVRSYCRLFPTVFDRAQGSWLYDRDGKSYIDFFCGAGSLNYGHNPPEIKRAIIDYLGSDGIAHGLDMATVAKENFLTEFESIILRPRGLEYRVQFVGPTGANGIEAALKLVRKVTNRRGIVAFTHAFHGLSSGALSITANTAYRNQSYMQRNDVTFMPFDGYLGESVDTLDYFERCLTDCGSGLDVPAAVILETVQAEGGVNVAGLDWLKRLQALCQRFQMLLIIDDVQAGCGRTGNFFSFERAGLYPDVVVLSKAISGFGLPMSIVLLKPEIDVWQPGEHSGTFRGNNLAFVSGAAALRFWRNNDFTHRISERSAILSEHLTSISREYSQLGSKVRGLGLIFGLDVVTPERAWQIVQNCFKSGLIIELCGPGRNVLKFLPSLVIEIPILHEAIARVRRAIEIALTMA